MLNRDHFEPWNAIELSVVPGQDGTSMLDSGSRNDQIVCSDQSTSFPERSVNLRVHARRFGREVENGEQVQECLKEIGAFG